MSLFCCVGVDAASVVTDRDAAGRHCGEWCQENQATLADASRASIFHWHHCPRLSLLSQV